MARDAQATKQRLLEAAIQEFSQYGIAGARVDRIAAAAGSNKAQIYTYFGSKDGLFEAVFEAMVIAVIDQVPIDTADLPGYAGRLFDFSLARAEQMRLVFWDQLERHGAGVRSSEVLAAGERKAASIKQAQDAGVISADLPAQILHMMVSALVTQAVFQLPPEHSDAGREDLRRSVVTAVGRLSRP